MNEAVTNLPISNAPAIIHTAIKLPENNIPIPVTEKNAATEDIRNADKASIFVNVLILLLQLN